MSLFKAFRERAAAFKNDDQGSMAVLFALTFSVMVGFIGAAIDITRAVQAKALLQQATDSAGLAAVNYAISNGYDLTSVSSFETAGDFIIKNLEAAQAERAPTELDAFWSMDIIGGDLVISAEAPLPSSFTRIFGVQELEVGVVSIIRIPSAAPSNTTPESTPNSVPPSTPATARAVLKG